MAGAIVGAEQRASRVDARVLAAVRARLSLELDPAIANPFGTDPERASTIRRAIVDALAESDHPSTSDPAVVDDIYDELIGLGPIQRFMADSRITDILVNRHDEIFIERDGILHRTDARFRDQAHLEQVIGKIVALVGREISIDKPLVDARMVDGSRANAVYAPVGGPTLCIRKFNKLRLALHPDGARVPGHDWVSRGGMSAPMARFLETMGAARANVLIAGATGAGKSTLLRAFVDAFPAHERIVTIEDTAELELANEHWVKLECVHHHELGAGDTSARRLDVADLVQNALRMRPDRLIIGEVRSSREAYHTLEALNTGHDGSATTIHASSAAEALSRLELLIGRDFSRLATRDIRGYIARVFDVIVFVTRLRTGRRCVFEICELGGVSDEGEYDLRPVFTTDIDHDVENAGPVFRATEDYQPGDRLRRKLQLQGASWVA